MLLVWVHEISSCWHFDGVNVLNLQVAVGGGLQEQQLHEELCCRTFCRPEDLELQSCQTCITNSSVLEDHLSKKLEYLLLQQIHMTKIRSVCV